MLNKIVIKCEAEYDEALKRGVRDPELGRLQQNLMKQYRKLWNMDHFRYHHHRHHHYHRFFILIILFVAYCF